jgi:hypothetical protein
VLGIDFSRRNVSPNGAPAPIVVPDDIWEYWLSVSRGTNGDYDESGSCTTAWAA